jgi:hypothetical protein
MDYSMPMPESQPLQSSATSWLLRGSLIVLRRRCGKPTCHCAKGPPHATPALSFSQQGKTRILTLRPPQLPGVRAALRRYHQAQAQLEHRAVAGLRRLTQPRTPSSH